MRSSSSNLAFTEQRVRRGRIGYDDWRTKIFLLRLKPAHTQQNWRRGCIGGAFSFSLSRGDPTAQTLKWGVAAATATVSTEGTTFCHLAETEATLPNVDWNVARIARIVCEHQIA